MQAVNGILYGGQLSEQIRKGTPSLGEYCLNKLKSKEDIIVLIDYVNNRLATTHQILNESLKIAIALRKHYDIGQGDVIGLISENRIEFLCILYATFFTGATITLINPTYNEREFRNSFDLTKPKLLFMSSTPSKIIQLGLQKGYYNYIKTIITFEAISNYSVNTQVYTEFIGNITNNDIKEFTCQPTEMDKNISILVSSSGTTGLPKIVQLSEWNIFVTISQVQERAKLLPIPELRTITTLPWYHVYGCFTSLGLVLCENVKLSFITPFKYEPFLSCIEAFQSNYIITAPPVMVFLGKNPLLKNFNVSSVQAISCGAAPLSKELTDEILKRFNNPGMRILQGYGMSEATYTLIGQTAKYNKSGSVGVLRVGVWGKIIDPDNGRLLKENQLGEILVKGDVIMKGYLKNPIETKRLIDESGWVHTGDIGYYDEDGEWFIVDRIKELIKYKGYQVAPSELETILLTHPDVKDAAVIGRPDDVAGELPMAFVVPHVNVQLTEQQIIDYVAARVSYTKYLRGGVQFIHEIPKNTTGKILRRVLRDQINIKSKL